MNCFEWPLRKGAEAAGAHTTHNPPPRTAQTMASIPDFLTQDSEGHQDHDPGIRLHRVTHTAKVKEHEALTDGSYYPESKLCGAAVVLPNGQAILIRVPGYAPIFKAELVAICIAAK